MSKASEQDLAIKTYLLSSIDGVGYGESPITTKEKADFVKRIFESEYGFYIKRYGYQRAVSEWLRGLPSAVYVEYRNHVILQHGVEWGFLSAEFTEREGDKFLDKWFNMVAAKLCQLMEWTTIPKELRNI